MKQLLKNIVQSLWTSIVGTFAGTPILIDGIQSNDTSKIVSGVSVILLGLLSKEK